MSCRIRSHGGAVIDEKTGEPRRVNAEESAKQRAIVQQKKTELVQEWIKEFGNEKGEIVIYTAKGCDVCGNTGYKGRVGLHELLIGTDRLKKDIQESARVAKMFATAMDDGMRTLKQDGIEKVLGGITDMAQVRAVCIK
jgi:type II secretory ATPase GspE/PulE/Tfp pilus assembly ATPase PilB-like protein